MQGIGIVGHSGCKLTIQDDIIYKTTKDNAYSKRLKKQCEKQKDFYNFFQNNEIFVVPEVLGEYWNISDIRRGGGGELGFVMPYYKANNFIDFFEKSSIDDIKKNFNNILLFVDENIITCPLKEIKTDILRNKCLEIESRLQTAVQYNFSIILHDILKEIDKLPDTIELPVGRCHGDLTFSNILFLGQKIVLIDFLDNFIETPLQDIVKLRQDTKHFWSLNLYNGEMDFIKIKMIFEFLDRAIDVHFKKYSFYEKYYKIFQKINMLRILPYAKEEKIVYYLLKEIYYI